VKADTARIPHSERSAEKATFRVAPRPISEVKSTEMFDIGQKIDLTGGFITEY
jgi:hypothetical protein